LYLLFVVTGGVAKRSVVKRWWSSKKSYV